MALVPQARTLLRSATGRQLSYLLWQAAQPSSQSANVLYFHGWPSTSSESRFIAQQAVRQGLSFACFDRPGVGKSSRMPGGITFRSVADDAAALCESLGWSKVVFMGTSGGGPYAAACAALLAPRGLTAGLVLNASMTHTWGPNSTPLMKGMDLGNRIGYALVNYAPISSRIGLAVGAALARHVALPVLTRAMGAPRTAGSASDSQSSPPSGSQPPVAATQTDSQGWSVSKAVMSLLGTGLPQADRAAMTAHASEALPILTSMISAVFGAEGYGEGLWQDMRLTSQPWTEFSLSDIHCPTLVVQGTDDVNVTVAMARHLAQQIPGTRYSQLRTLWADATRGTSEGQGVNTGSSARQGVLSSAPDPPGLILAEGQGHMSLILNCGGHIMQCAKRLSEVKQAA